MKKVTEKNLRVNDIIYNQENALFDSPHGVLVKSSPQFRLVEPQPQIIH
jgi:hypothetical protein